MGRGLVFSGQPCPHPKEAGSQHCPIELGCVSIYAWTVCHRTTIFDIVTSWGGSCILGSATPPVQESGGQGLLNFWGSPVFMPTEQPNLSW